MAPKPSKISILITHNLLPPFFTSSDLNVISHGFSSITPLIDVENYSENDHKLLCYYSSPSPILASAFSPSNIRGTPLLLLGCGDKTIYILNASTLVLLGQITISLKLEHLALPNYDIKCLEKNYFQLFSIDSLLTFQDTLLVGLSNGIVEMRSLESFKQGKILNPIPLEFPLQEDERKSITIENAMISGIESLAFSERKNLIIVNHKAAFTNCLNETFNLRETPICIYKQNGDPVKRLKVQGEIKQGKVLENRGLYLCLTSVDSHLYIIDLARFTVIKMSLDFVGDPDKPLLFTGMSVHESQPSQRLFKTEKASDKKGKGSKDVVDGDILFGIEAGGSILVSKLTYEGKMHWVPVKYLDSGKLKKKKSRQSILFNAARSKGSMHYEKEGDRLYLTDHTDQVVILSDILKKSL